MSKFFKSLGLAISILVAAVIVLGCSSSSGLQAEPPSKRPTNGLVQSSTGGAVTIDVEWVGEENNALVFDVAMNTHSVDLDTYDLGDLAVLRDNEGKEYRPISWRSDPGGHHRRGTLSFPFPDSLRQGNAKYLELSIQDVAGVKERVLKWELGAA